MKTAYLITKQDGSTVLLFDAARANGLARHYGWTVKVLSAAQATARIRSTLKG
jgi:hypothetical protein